MASNDTLHSTFRHLTIVCDFTASKSQETIVITFQAGTARYNRWIQVFFRRAAFELSNSRLDILTGLFFSQIAFNGRNQCIETFVADGTVVTAVVTAKIGRASCRESV